MKTKQQNRGVFLAVSYPPISTRFSGLYTKPTHRFFTPFQNEGGNIASHQDKHLEGFLYYRAIIYTNFCSMIIAGVLDRN